jgi:peptidoglycan hydrolase-like protein with peptidoglycan-binding domain
MHIGKAGPTMATNYIVKQGDYISSIAKSYGFSDQAIWNHPNNAALKVKRKTPNVLSPGDQVFIPDQDPSAYQRPTDRLHQFEVQLTKVKLRLVLEDMYEKPIAHAKCVLVLDSDSHQLTTDGSGKLEQEIPRDAHAAQLVILDAQTPFQNDVFSVKIGYMTPVEEVSGQAARLDNLGYVPGDGSQAQSGAFESAVEEFQCDNGLSVDGVCGPITQAKLKQVYGC